MSCESGMTSLRETYESFTNVSHDMLSDSQILNWAWETLGLQRMHSKNARKEIDRLRRWVDYLQSGMYINCVYCGHRYGPRESTPESMANVLKRHIEVCPEHPMSKLKAENQRLREALKQAHVEVTKAQLGEEYEPDVDVLSMLERFTGWNGSTYEQALAQTELHNPSDPTTVDLGSGKVFIGTGYQGSNAIIWFRPTGVEQEIGSIDPDFKEGEQHFNATDIIVSISNIESTQVLREALDYCMEVLAQTAQGGKEE